MKRLPVIGILIAIILLSVFPVHAQSNVVIDQMMIEIWPEYDRPEVLVIYRIKLSPEVSLPAQLSILIPREAGAPYNLAMQDMDGLLYNLSYSTEVQNDSLKVIFTTPTDGLQIEYYDPDLQNDGNKRQFVYEWVAEYDVNNLSITIQQPVNASNMQILPNFGPGEIAGDGFTYYTTSIGEVDAGTRISVDVSYNKPDDQLSVGLQPVQPSQPLGTSTPGKTNPGDILPWILGGVGIVLLFGGFVWFFFTKTRVSTGSQSRRRHKTATERRTEAPLTSEAVYCHQCGRRAGTGDVFCRTCGTRLRNG